MGAEIGWNSTRDSARCLGAGEGRFQTCTDILLLAILILILIILVVFVFLLLFLLEGLQLTPRRLVDLLSA